MRGTFDYLAPEVREGARDHARERRLRARRPALRDAHGLAARTALFQLPAECRVEGDGDERGGRRARRPRPRRRARSRARGARSLPGRERHARGPPRPARRGSRSPAPEAAASRQEPAPRPDRRRAGAATRLSSTSSSCSRLSSIVTPALALAKAFAPRRDGFLAIVLVYAGLGVLAIRFAWRTAQWHAEEETRLALQERRA